jgi:acetamidase/formamidase
MDPLRAGRVAGGRAVDPADPMAGFDVVPTVPVVIGDDLDEAAAEALSAMLDLLGALHGLGRSEAMALASVVGSLRVTQVANQVFGVHALLPHDALT